MNDGIFIPYGVAQAETKAVNALGSKKTYYVIKISNSYCAEFGSGASKTGGFNCVRDITKATQYPTMAAVLNRLATSHASTNWRIVRVVDTVEQVPAKRVVDEKGTKFAFASGCGFVRFFPVGWPASAQYDVALSEATLFVSDNEALTELQQGMRRFTTSLDYRGGILSRGLNLVRVREIPADTKVTRTETVVE